MPSDDDRLILPDQPECDDAGDRHPNRHGRARLGHGGLESAPSDLDFLFPVGTAIVVAFRLRQGRQ